MAPALRDRLTADGLDEDALRNLAALIEAQRACTGAVPTDRRLVVEACPDETGDMRVILHSPFGRRVHEPWALAVAHRITSTLGFDPQAVASDDGIVLRVPAAEDALPGSDLFRFDSDELESIVRERVGFTALFAARFRECAGPALAHGADGPGQAGAALAAASQGRSAFGGGRREEDFPIILEALRECLQDVFDLQALRRGDGRSCLGLHQDERSSHGRAVAFRGAARVRVSGRAPLRGRSAPCRAPGIASVRGSGASRRASGHRCCGRYAGCGGGGEHRGRAAADGRGLEGAGRGRRGRPSAGVGAAHGGGGRCAH